MQDTRNTITEDMVMVNMDMDCIISLDIMVATKLLVMEGITVIMVDIIITITTTPITVKELLRVVRLNVSAQLLKI